MNGMTYSLIQFFFLHETDEINENNVTDLYNKMNRTIDNKY